MAKEKIAIVVSRFNEEITMKMKNKAIQRAKELQTDIVKIAEVPGAFEIPLAVKRLLENKNIDGVVTIGAVIKGDTDHDVVIVNSVAGKLLSLSINYNKPVSLGILGPNIKWQQAEKRINDYATRAVDAVVDALGRR